MSQSFGRRPDHEPLEVPSFAFRGPSQSKLRQAPQDGFGNQYGLIDQKVFKYASDLFAVKDLSETEQMYLLCVIFYIDLPSFLISSNYFTLFYGMRCKHIYIILIILRMYIVG
ncbi:Hypothetical_protein [Hexamita inflata]|uniref:Hypothetical_protein n=1 Tax=Hexamita inflata TaxID=28002 RepID=A0AA86TW19_9EUKA|nr:Hypothetical protein HINF_LOCUS18599 [Hexamita inflata]